MKKMEDTFQRIAAVYLEDIIEFQQLPEKAIVSRIQSSAGEFPESVTYSLPGVANPGINTYLWFGSRCPCNRECAGHGRIQRKQTVYQILRSRPGYH